MTYLTELVLNFNRFKEVPSSLSVTASSLKVLYLNANPIEHVKSKTFDKLLKLEIISISYMSELKYIENGNFDNLKLLKVIKISGNKKLYSIPLSDFLHLKQLKELDMSNNNLTTLSFRLGSEEFKRYNNNYFVQLHTMSLANNPWRCDCNLLQGLLVFNENSSYLVKALKVDEARCALPFDLYSISIYSLSPLLECVGDKSEKQIKLLTDKPPKFLRPKSLMLTIFSVAIVTVLGVIIGILIVCFTRKFKSNRNEDVSFIRYSEVRSSLIQDVSSFKHQQH